MTHDEKGEQGLNEAEMPLLRRCLGLNKELNNPLAGIVGYCEFLLDGKDTLSTGQKLSIEEIRDFALRIQETLEQVAALKADLAKKIDLEALEEKDTQSVDSKATD